MTHRHTVVGSDVLRDGVCIATAVSSHEALRLQDSLNLLDALLADGISKRVQAVKIDADETISKLAAKIEDARLRRDANLAELRSKCHHQWGEWRYAYEMPSIRTCDICGLQEEH